MWWSGRSRQTRTGATQWAAEGGTEVLRGGSHGTTKLHVAEVEEMEWSQNVLGYYRGTYAETLPSILSEGPRPTLGAGA